MNLRFASCLFLLAPIALAARADVVSCPDLAAAVQVGTCPAEEDLRYTYTGYCSDDARMYRGDNDVCADYRRYRKLKNVVLWESADGAFQAYVSCDLPAATLRQARAATMSVGKQGKITRLTCGYGEGLAFTYRTRAECKVQTASCSADAACKASCD
jgi:hypothetical protein